MMRTIKIKLMLKKEKNKYFYFYIFNITKNMFIYLNILLVIIYNIY